MTPYTNSSMTVSLVATDCQPDVCTADASVRTPTSRESLAIFDGTSRCPFTGLSLPLAQPVWLQYQSRHKSLCLRDSLRNYPLLNVIDKQS